MIVLFEVIYSKWMNQCYISVMEQEHLPVAEAENALFQCISAYKEVHFDR